MSKMDVALRCYLSVWMGLNGMDLCGGGGGGGYRAPNTVLKIWLAQSQKIHAMW